MDQVTDTKPRRPTAGIMDGGDVVSTAVAAWGSLVVFGDSEGDGLLRPSRQTRL